MIRSRSSCRCRTRAPAPRRAPEDILDWTDGRALVATGGPSRDVAGPTGRRVIGQANNVFIFPGMGLGAIVAETREVTDDLFLVAAHELADLTSDERLASGALYPPIADLRAVARADRHRRGPAGQGQWIRA